ncbi:type II toxin-antitoxin system RelE/ParE family toxin [Microaerobacter geothermalis]|uniref:type II toxin-antitoxin system RelE/ParE family toxin n=1 Tax=Microaerobacter geothermalis TaxID=674972 RepID=UPI001F291751|nr:type II toxin-antitoxin system RelE/ParE family toxin [Microaerobacter geothermalis]MCF6094364.1 type II toxin-antitoxin system RelE/ParE family toxin [Microaerobacter geothermalis]
MSAYIIQITEPAEKDLFEIGSYISKELLEPETAKKVISKIAKGIYSLEELPLRNALVTDERLAQKGIRKIMVDNYIVFYIVNEESKTVTIIRILYGRRDWLNIL